MEKTLRQRLYDKVERYGNKIYDELGDILTTEVSKKGALGLGLVGVIGLGSVGCATTGLRKIPEDHQAVYGSYEHSKINEKDAKYKIDILAEIPYERSIVRSYSAGEPIKHESIAKIAKLLENMKIWKE